MPGRSSSSGRGLLCTGSPRQRAAKDGGATLENDSHFNLLRRVERLPHQVRRRERALDAPCRLVRQLVPALALIVVSRTLAHRTEARPRAQRRDASLFAKTRQREQPPPPAGREGVRNGFRRDVGPGRALQASSSTASRSKWNGMFVARRFAMHAACSRPCWWCYLHGHGTSAGWRQTGRNSVCA